MTGPFAQAVNDYYQAGWRCILPVPPETKTPPPEGFTGAEGIDVVDVAQLNEWAANGLGASSIALRLPDGVVGIDVDHYDKPKRLPDGSVRVVHKRGGDTIAALEQRLGPLPPTWVSSARAWPSGIRFYRVPAGRYRTSLGAESAVEIIQRHHRYAVVAPSFNHEAGAAYCWRDPLSYVQVDASGQPSNAVPTIADLTELPPAWVEHLREGAVEQGPESASIAAGEELLRAVLADGRLECPSMADARLVALAELAKATEGSRHDVAVARVHRTGRAAALGHPGAAVALPQVGVWAAVGNPGAGHRVLDVGNPVARADTPAKTPAEKKAPPPSPKEKKDDDKQKPGDDDKPGKGPEKKGPPEKKEDGDGVAKRLDRIIHELEALKRDLGDR